MPAPTLAYIAICRRLGLSDAQIRNALAAFVNPAHRREVLRYHGKQIHYLRMKQENPDTIKKRVQRLKAKILQSGSPFSVEIASLL